MWTKMLYKRILSKTTQHGQVAWRRNSVVFIPRHKASDYCVIVNPHLDSSRWLKDMETLKNNVSARKSQFDPDKLKSVWDFFKDIEENTKHLENVYNNIRKNITDLKENNLTDVQETEKLEKHKAIVNEDLKELKRCLWSIEETAMLQALSMPNILHARTPRDQEKIINQTGEFDNPSNSDHLKLGKDLGILNYSSPQRYYLRNEAALFELGATFHFSKLLRRAGFIQFSNPDFSRSVIVEGCGFNHTDANATLILHNTEQEKMAQLNRLHLTGGASVFAFAAYHLRNELSAKALPLRYFAVGRKYKPFNEDARMGLFGVGQATAAEVFISTSDSVEQLDAELDNIIEITKNIYKSINLPFKISYLPAFELHDWESLRVCFQMWSSSLKQFIEVANISVSDDYISKRLTFLYKEKDNKYKYPKIISGTILNVPLLLGCALERSNEQFLLPSEFDPSHWA